ncbi:MAG: hypothetical protein M1820_006176 [Bogoriella megaspora]|nr:MAG: hypothetical protein M1820_006176 [Bogoriella megaspora]
MLRLSALLALGLGLTAHAVTIDMEGLPDTGLDTSSWTTGTAPPIASLVDLNDLQIAAKNTLAPADYAYYRTGALDEISYNFSLPFFIAPAAQAGRANSGAETNLVKAANTAGILYVPSISSTQTIEQIAAAKAANQVLFHQEYIWSNTSRLQDELNRMQKGGFKAIFLTVDNTGIAGVRDRQMRFSDGGDTGHAANFTLAALAQVQKLTTLPIVPKGIKTAHDAKLCADLGFKAIYISNHGGRVVDGAPTAVEILLDIHQQYPEIFNQVEIYADGGVRRATHILALLALGAKAVGVGRPAMFSNLYGTSGVTKMINILKQELLTEMALLGQADVDRWRGNTTFINTKQIELEYFGAPL